MNYIYCDEKKQRVNEAVCEGNVKNRRCTKDLLGCKMVKVKKAPELKDDYSYVQEEPGEEELKDLSNIQLSLF